MNRATLLCAILAFSAAALGAQQTGQSNPYEGVSTPPSNDSITTEAPAPPPKPRAAHPIASQAAQPAPPAHYVAGQPAVSAQAATPAQTQDRPAPGQVAPDFITSDGTDGGIVEVPSSAPPAQPQTRTRPQPSQPTVLAHLYASDPDGDIVHPHPLPPGELGTGTVIEVRLLNELASGINQPGDTFRSQVVMNVLQDGEILIPAGSEIDGRVLRVSSGDGLGSSGYMDLRPETVILPNGKHYRMYAIVSGTSGSHTRVGAEGTVRPGSRVKRDAIGYGAGMGAGAATGAIVAGPVGALTGTVVGAALITAHLLTSHPQATLDANSALTFTLTEPLDLVAVNTNDKGE
jgi:hypothetical protein